MGLFNRGQRAQERRVAELVARTRGLEPYLKAGRFAEVEPTVRELLGQAEAEFGQDHRLTRLLRCGSQQAASQAREALAAARAAYPEEHGAVRRIREVLAAAEGTAGH